MARACARCGTLFGGQWAIFMMWCKVDRFYVCRRCWEWECHEGHGEGRKNVGWSILQGLVALGFVFLLVGFVGPAAVWDGVRIQSYASLPVTTIRDLPAAGTVKVQGVIVDVDPIAWGGREVDTDNGWTWEWSTTDSFWVFDGTGVVAVLTNRWWVVEWTSHSAPFATHTASSVYLPGDSILLVAEVRRGATDLQLEAVYASPDGFRMDPWVPTLLGALAIAPFLIALDLILRARHRRAVLHRQHSVTAPAEGAGGEASPDATLPWSHNPRMSPRSRVLLVIAVCAFTIAGVIALLAVWPAHTRTDFYVVSVVSGLLLAFGVGLPIIALFDTPIRPTAMALTDRGVNFWYASRYERQLEDGFIAWDEIKAIELRKSGKESWRALERKNGVTDNLKVLSADNWKKLSEAWKIRAQAPPLS